MTGEGSGDIRPEGIEVQLFLFSDMLIEGFIPRHSSFLFECELTTITQHAQYFH